MKTKFTMMMAVIATFAISLNLHSSNEEVVFGAPAVQMPRGGPKYCAFEAKIKAQQKELAKEMKELQKEFGDDKTKAPQSGSMRDRVNQILNEDK